MPVNLTKGQRISLAKEAGKQLDRVYMGLGWDTMSVTKPGFLGFGSRTVKVAVDLDASCVMFDHQDQHVDTVWFRQLQSRDGSVLHSGDNLTGEGDGDDEQIRVNLGSVPANVKALVFTVNCYSHVNFSQVANASCRLVDEATRREVASFNLTCGGPHTGLILAKVYRHEGEWKMHAIGEVAEGRTWNQMLPTIAQLL